jgi:S-adenosylmethionine:tRNA ribosyltransferase-isomerase
MLPNYSNESEKDRKPAVEAEGRLLKIGAYTYALPDERIALHPLENRDDSKLLVLENDQIADRNFKDLPELLSKGDLLVFNRSRVILARLFFQTAAGSNIEIFCISEAEKADHQITGKSSAEWFCMVGRAAKWKEGEILRLSNSDGLELTASNTGRKDDLFRIRFEWNTPEIDFIQLLDAFGNLPLPPYLHREPDASDLRRYQTVYASEAGSVAAPTAGLHFTDDLLNRLSQKGVDFAYITLHVGSGTFRPVKSDTLAGHDMHREEYFIPIETLEQLAACKGKIIAVGTTTLRTLESVFIGTHLHPDTVPQEVGQWEGIDHHSDFSKSARTLFKEAAESLRHNNQAVLHGFTSLLVCPPYSIKTIEGLITNFHQPESTLLVLIAAAIGEKWKAIYAHALKNGYRFLSYGDASLLMLG